MDSYEKLKAEKDRIMAREREKVAQIERERISKYFAGVSGVWTGAEIATAIREQWDKFSVEVPND